MVGSEKAYSFLVSNGFESEYAEKVKHCIRTHRYRKNNLPESLEAKMIARERQDSAIAFYNSLCGEVKASYENGVDELGRLLE